MLTAILADDEAIVRSSMAKWIPWKELGIKLTGMAADGEEAYEMIVRLHPDIVITDIRMPRLDGLGLIERVSAHLKDTEFIILSGFSEFEYAQTAMRYGVRHYMLKPALKEDLKACLLEVKEEIEKRQKTRLGSYFGTSEKYGFYMQLAMLMEVLSDPSSIGTIIDRSRRLVPFDPEEVLTQFAVQVLEPDRFISLILPAVREMGVRIPVYPVSSDGKVFLTFDISSISDLEAVKNEIALRRGVILDVRRGTPSELVSWFVKRAGEFKEAAIYDDDGHKESVRLLPRYMEREDELVRRYRDVLSGGSDPLLMDEVEQVFRQKELDEAEALFVRMALRSTDYELLFKELGNVRTADDLVALARSFTDHKVPRDRDPFPVESVIRYIKENFSNPEISLKWISENVVYMNPEYLSRLFQREVGQRFTDYLNTTRVDEARKLMTVYHKSTVGEIAEKVGYSNPGYFFHIFRRYTGMTPGEYMDKVRKSSSEESNG